MNKKVNRDKECVYYNGSTGALDPEFKYIAIAEIADERIDDDFQIWYFDKDKNFITEDLFNG